MVPYVRKSFFKHYIDGAIYIGKKDIKWITQNIQDYICDPKCFVDEQSIDHKIWKENPEIYQYALDMTEREIHQAVEGMYHNLNTL
jgi:ribonucleoside-triphosphate reductase